MIKRIAIGVQVAGMGVVAYAGFLVSDWIGFGLTGAGLCLVGVMLEREAG